jgi:hypothetical protein
MVVSKAYHFSLIWISTLSGLWDCSQGVWMSDLAETASFIVVSNMMGYLYTIGLYVAHI